MVSLTFHRRKKKLLLLETDIVTLEVDFIATTPSAPTFTKVELSTIVYLLTM